VDAWAHVSPHSAVVSFAKRDVNAAPTAANASPTAVKQTQFTWKRGGSVWGKEME